MQFEERLAALKDELLEAGRRATTAESELELVRLELTELRAQVNRPQPEGGAVDPVQVVGTETGGPDADRLRESAAHSAARLHAQAELDLVRAQQQAVRVLRSAADESQALLTAALASIERHTAVAEAVREQAERDSEEAATLRGQLQASLAAIEAEAERIRTEAEAEARAVIDEAERQAAASVSDIRRRLAAEVVALREVMDRARDSFGLFAAAQADPPAAAQADPPAGRSDRREAQESI